MITTESHIYRTQANRVQAALLKVHTAPNAFLRSMQTQTAREEFNRLRIMHLGRHHAHLN